MKILFISNLFPDVTEPVRGLDNARLLRELVKHCDVRALALRPTRGVPPFWRPKSYRCRPEDEPLSPVFCPAAYIPKIGSRVNHLLMARTMRDSLLQIRNQFAFDVVLCAWVYPDGCAVAELSRELAFPFVVIAQGSDVHQYLKMPARQKIIPSALNQSRGVITRSGDLARLLQKAGVKPDKLHTIYNGVDFDRYHPSDQRQARSELGLSPDRPIILFVGNFLPIKNPLLLVAAHAEMNRRLPDKQYQLVMVGDGPLLKEVERVLTANVAGKLAVLAGRQPPDLVARYMQAADVLCLSSDNEGVPNVVLEAFACGLRVVTTDVGGIAEVLCHDFLGRLVPPRKMFDLVTALAETLAAPLQREKITHHAHQFSWEQTAAAYSKALAGKSIAPFFA